MTDYNTGGMVDESYQSESSLEKLVGSWKLVALGIYLQTCLIWSTWNFNPF